MRPGQGRSASRRYRWGTRTTDWFEVDLAAWSRILEIAPPQAGPAITQTLQHCKAGPELAGLREPAALAKLPADEQQACRALWKDVDALLAKARGTAR
jgi:hypothetical protein